MPTGGRNTKKDADSDEGLKRSSIIENAQADFAANKQITLETLIATDRFVEIKIPTAFAKALGIGTATELETQINALGVTDAIKRYIAPKKTTTTDEGRANTSSIPSIILTGGIIGTLYKVKLHTPITYTYKGTSRKRRWMSVRVPNVVSIAAFSLFLARFATTTRMPPGFTTIKGSRLYVPTNSTTGLTKVDKVTDTGTAA